MNCGFGRFFQVPYYLGEMNEQIAQEDRIPILNASQDHLKVNNIFCGALVDLVHG
jgi:immunoglobulin-binding protein 1